MATQRQLFVFGDQTTVFAPDLRKLAGVKNNSSLLNFFERVHLALREEIAGLPAPERKLFPRFSNLGELLARYEEAARNPALDSALSCVFQLACFLKYVL
jgi:naphtho-gamma-pyrone polyketide synthase